MVSASFPYWSSLLGLNLSIHPPHHLAKCLEPIKSVLKLLNERMNMKYVKIRIRMTETRTSVSDRAEGSVSL